MYIEYIDRYGSISPPLVCTAYLVGMVLIFGRPFLLFSRMSHAALASFNPTYKPTLSRHVSSSRRAYLSSRASRIQFFRKGPSQRAQYLTSHQTNLLLPRSALYQATSAAEQHDSERDFSTYSPARLRLLRIYQHRILRDTNQRHYTTSSARFVFKLKPTNHSSFFIDSSNPIRIPARQRV
jgi:hypothetical protein